MRKRVWPWRRARDYGTGILGVTAATGLLWMARAHLDKAHVGLVYLLVIAWVGVSSGTGPAVVASGLSFLTWDYFFLPPFFTLALNDSQDWILLLVFLAIGVLVGGLAGRMRERAAEALAREKETSALYRAIVAAGTRGNMAESGALLPLVEEAARASGAVGCAILLSEEDPLTAAVQWGDVEDLKRRDTQLMARWSMENAKAIGLPAVPMFIAEEEAPWPVSVGHAEVLQRVCARSDLFLPLHTEERTFGLMYAMPPEGKAFSESDCRLLIALAGTATTFLERRRLQNETSRLAADREAERLRSVLLSSLSHNLKTPLSSLSATLDNLRRSGAGWSSERLRENLEDMADDVKRLTAYMENLLNLAKLESGSWKPRKEWIEFQEILGISLCRLSESEYRRIRIQLPLQGILIRIDSAQMSQVISHLLENALAYSPPNSIVHISARLEEDFLILTVDNLGAEIPDDEKELIFEKFYRGRIAVESGIRGTGLGLSICKEIVEAHGGTIAAQDAPEGGTRIVVKFPIQSGT